MRWMLAVAAAAFGMAAYAQDVGQIKTTKGAVHVERAGQRIAAAPGMNVRASDKLVTGADGAVGVTFLDNTMISAGPSTVFEIERYLEHQGRKFVERFDANSYLRLLRAIDLYDAAEGYASLAESFARIRLKKALVASFTSDWLYPTYQSRELADALCANGIEVTAREIESDYGHDSFLLEHERLAPLFREVLR